MKFRVGIDTGGTFTDLVAINRDTGQLLVAKERSTPERPSGAVGKVLQKMKDHIPEIYFLILGTTIATNALIQRRGANVAYITTKGFEDVPFIQRLDKEEVYNLQWQKPKPLIKRANCFGVEERIGYKGQIIKPLDWKALKKFRQVIDKQFKEDNLNAIAICLLFSYLNNAHEQKLQEYLQQHYPGLSISASHKVCPLWREFERSSTTIADAFVKPITIEYVENLKEEFSSMNIEAPWCVMKSNGGSMFPEVAAKEPVQTLLSGLAGGVIGGRYFGKLAGDKNLFTLDMGGTSCDVGIVEDGQQSYASEFQLGFGLPISVPCVEVSTIGAGGGSIGWRDKGGFLRVGPFSAGASPGPAAYGEGGIEPTVTDANLILGYLNPSYFLGGSMPLFKEKAQQVMEPLAKKLGISILEAAEGIRRVVNENMSNALRLVAVKRGVNPKDFALVAFGGAGPLHAVAIAEVLGIPRIIIPLHPGHCSAFGALISDWRVDRVLTRLYRSDMLDVKVLNEEFIRLTQEAIEELSQEGFSGESTVLRSIDMRYQGQNYEHEVIVSNSSIDENEIKAAFNKFAEQYESFSGFSHPNAVIELVNLRVTAKGISDKPKLENIKKGGSPEPVEKRSVFISQGGFTDIPIYRRTDLQGNLPLHGPAIIEEVASTTVIPKGYTFKADENSILIILREDMQNV